MKTLRVCALVLAALVSSSSVWAQRGSSPVIVDDNYILALNAADEFLHAWATRDAVAGRATLTPAAIKRHSPDDLAMVFQGVSSPHHESFEIGPGRRLSATKYAFDVIEYAYMTKMGARDPRPTPARIVVVQVAPEKWLVDEFPDS